MISPCHLMLICHAVYCLTLADVKDEDVDYLILADVKDEDVDL